MGAAAEEGKEDEEDDAEAAEDADCGNDDAEDVSIALSASFAACDIDAEAEAGTA